MGLLFKTFLVDRECPKCKTLYRKKLGFLEVGKYSCDIPMGDLIKCRNCETQVEAIFYPYKIYQLRGTKFEIREGTRLEKYLYEIPGILSHVVGFLMVLFFVFWTFEELRIMISIREAFLYIYGWESPSYGWRSPLDMLLRTLGLVFSINFVYRLIGFIYDVHLLREAEKKRKIIEHWEKHEKPKAHSSGN